jgi:hypothetical protein
MVCTSVSRNKNATMTDAPKLSIVDGGGLLPSPKIGGYLAAWWFRVLRISTEACPKSVHALITITVAANKPYTITNAFA